LKETDFPPLYTAADAASKSAQKQFLGVLGTNFVLLVAAATMSVVNYPHPTFAICQAAILASSLGLVVFLAVKQPQRIWYGTRALAESIKTITWRYVMRAEPFNADEVSSRDRFVASVKKIFDDNKEVSSHAVEFTVGSLITPMMNKLRSQSLAERKASYRKHRILDQQEWYARKALWNKNTSRAWFVGLILINVIALGLAIFRIEYPSAEHWPTDIFVAMAASAMGWVQTKRFQELAGSYTLTAHEIVLLDAMLPGDEKEDKFSSFVGDAENAFSREHTQWRARRDLN
jgi:SMODS and SLOG-associating 2TM effector domain 3/SMODS and SLOG-associating 2TM effector domain 1